MKPLCLFVIYAPADKALRDDFDSHLTSLRQDGLVGPLEESQAGDDKRASLDRMREADRILLLVSPDLLASLDLEVILDQAGERIVLVLLRSVDLPRSLAALRALPHGNPPVAVSAWPNRDEAWASVVTELRRQFQVSDQSKDASADTPLLPPNNLPRLPQDIIGREDATITLGHLVAGKAVTLWGLPGVGKSWLTLEYAHRNGGSYPGGIFWVQAAGDPVDSMALLAQDLTALVPAARAVLALIGDKPTAERSARQVRLALQSLPAPTLLILDNIDRQGWSEHIPGGRVSIIATTIDRSLALPGTNHGLTVPPLGVSLAIAGPAAPTPHEEARVRVVRDALGGLPLAAAVAMRGVRRWHLSWTEYELLIAQEAARFLEDDKVLGAYPRGVFAALDLSIARCVEPAARRLLLASALFSPDSIPISWLAGAAGVESGMNLRSALANLEDLALLTQEANGHTISVHQLVQQRARSLAAPEEWGKVQVDGAVWVFHWLLTMDIDLNLTEIAQRRSHIESVLALVEEKTAHWGFLAARYAKYLLHSGELPRARDIFAAVAAKEEEKWGERSPLLVIALSGLGRTLLDSGDAKEAKKHLERAMNLGSKIRGDTSLSAAQGLADLAIAFQDLGDLQQARALLERAIELDEKLGMFDLRAANLSNLSRVLFSMGELAQARRCSEQAIAMAEQHYGGEHPRTAMILSNLASAVHALGDLQTARQYFERAIIVLERCYGPMHAEVASRLNNLAGVLEELRDADAALRLRERALAIAEKALGPVHPKTAVFLSNLGSLKKDRGDTHTALSLLMRALQIQEKCLGPDHTDITATLRNLAVVNHELGEPDQALACIRRCIKIHEDGNHTTRPEYASSLTTLAELYQAQGRGPDALAILLRAQQITESFSISDQPLLMRILNAIASTQHAMGNTEQCIAPLQRLLSIAEQRGGQDQPEVATYLWNLAAMGTDSKVAIVQLERALSIHEKFGDDEQIARCAYRLASLRGEDHERKAIRQLLERGLAAAERAGDGALIAEGHYKLALMFLESRNNIEVLRHSQAAIFYYAAYPGRHLQDEATARLLVLRLNFGLGPTESNRRHLEWLRDHRNDEQILPETKQIIAQLISFTRFQ